LEYKKFIQIYALLVCFVAAIILLVSSVMCLDAITSMFLTKYKYYDHWVKCQSIENNTRSTQSSTKSSEIQPLSAEELKEKKQTAEQQFMATKKRKAVEQLIVCLQWLTIAGMFFLIHWKIYKKNT
jgi:hypothetical protein